MLNYVANLSNSGKFSSRFISETKTVTPNIFFAFLAQVTHYLTSENNSKKYIEWKMFRANILNKEFSCKPF